MRDHDRESLGTGKPGNTRKWALGESLASAKFILRKRGTGHHRSSNQGNRHQGEQMAQCAESLFAGKTPVSGLSMNGPRRSRTLGGRERQYLW